MQNTETAIYPAAPVRLEKFILAQNFCHTSILVYTQLLVFICFDQSTHDGLFSIDISAHNRVSNKVKDGL